MKTKLLSLILLTFFVGGTALAQRPSRTDNRRHPAMANQFRQGNRERIAQFLNLTEDQKEAIKQVRLESAKKAKPLRDELRELNAKHQTLVTAEKPDMDAIYKSIDKMGNVKIEIEKIKAEQQQKFRALLTEEQLLKLDHQREMIKNSPMNLRHQERRRI